MTETPPSDVPVIDDIPQAIARKPMRLGLIWIVPLVAALIGGWLVAKALVQSGPTITITFKSAEGLQAGKTRIRYKEVEIGKVDSIRLSKDLSQVVVTASLVKEVKHYLSANTRFWIVRARVAAGGVSGLGTLFSGAYIGMDPGPVAEHTLSFVGLESPPVVAIDTPGSYYTLRADRLGSLDIGSPVYYRQIKVGQVISYAMIDDGSAIDIQIFIQAPHNQKVRRNTRFWNTSGLNVTLDTSGVKVDTESLMTLLIGGIGFDTPLSLSPGEVAAEDYPFILYNSRDQIEEPTYTEKHYLVAFFDETVRGLNKGAPVEFRGIKVGEVVDVRLEFDEKKIAFRIPVLMAIEPERIAAMNGSPKNHKNLVSRLVEKGLRAQLRTGVLLTGQLYVNLDMYPNAAPATLAYSGPHPVIPAIAGSTEEIAAGIANFVRRLEKLPLEEIGADLRASLRSINRLVGSEDMGASLAALRKALEQLNRFTATLNNESAPQINAALEQLRQVLEQTEKTIASADGLINGQTPLTYDLQKMMQELTKAGRAISVLADYLQRHPEALVFGKGAPPP
jgi:paraquat-inducible protein B